MFDGIFGDDEDEEDDAHRCNDYEVIERGNWVPDHDHPIVHHDRLEVEFRQEVVIQCTECGETQRGTDRTKRKVKTIPFESEEIEDTENEDEERQQAVRIDSRRGVWVTTFGVDGI